MSYLLNISSEKLRELKIQASKEGTTIKAIIEQQIDTYLEQHKDGNPQYTIDQFEDPNAVACPAFWRPMDAWEKYFNQASPEEIEKMKNQIIAIDKRLSRAL